MAKSKTELNNAPVESGGSDLIEVVGQEQSLDELTVQDYMAFPPSPPVTPSWKKTRYPVSMEKYKSLCLAAQKMDAKSTKRLAADPAPVADIDEELPGEGPVLDFPEDGEIGVAAGAPEAAAPITGHSFQGINATGWQPADCAIAVGDSDNVLAGVNVDLADFRKSGALRFRWPSFTTLFRNVTPTGASLFDPQVAFDHYAKRWIVVLAARRNAPQGSWCMLGVSKTSDPGGSWSVWALNASIDGGNPSNNWMDYPQLGFDTQAIYIGMNQFQFGGGFQYAKIRILNKSEVYAGGSIKWYDFWNLKNPDGSQAFTVLPCTHFRGTGGNPNAYLINALWPGGNTLTLWTLADPIGYWSGRTPALTKVSVACAAYELPPDALQRDGANRIETNDSRLMNAVFQHAGGVQRLWTCHCDKGSWGGDTEARSVVQWYEIDVPTKKVIQQNAYGASGQYYYYPAIEVDFNRNAYLIFGRSSANEYASLRQTGRRVNAPLNDLEGSRLVKAGESAYTGNRWGDYFGICRDGADSGRVWGFGMYAAQRGMWGTWICSMKY